MGSHATGHRPVNSPIGCPMCHQAHPYDATFCPACGAKLPQTENLARGIEYSTREPQLGKGLLSPPAFHIRLRRLAAGFLDCAVAYSLSVLPGRVGLFAPISRRLAMLMIIPAAYLVFRDSLSGKSLGKFLFSLRVYNATTGKPGDFADSVLRNWFFVVIVLPPSLRFLSLGGIVFSLLALVVAGQIIFGAGQRLGETRANTFVGPDRLPRPVAKQT